VCVLSSIGGFYGHIHSSSSLDFLVSPHPDYFLLVLRVANDDLKKWEDFGVEKFQIITVNTHQKFK
jgi:hypothetical protein